MPKVSVIIPNYNHAHWLPQRIESVLNQTITDIEVLILDDCSPDNSLEVIRSYAQKDKRVQVIENTTNSGSTFKQWNKGVSLAKGDYIWIAESDDYAELNFLETLLPYFEQDKDVVLAYAQSTIVNEEGETIISYNKNYQWIYKTDRWSENFVEEGKVMAANYLVYHNCIPNASAVLMRRDKFLEVGGADETMTLNGDWYFYAKLLMLGKVAFNAQHLNWFRKHTATQRAKGAGTYVVYDEILTIVNYIQSKVDVPEENLEKSYRNISHWWMGTLFSQKKNKKFWPNNLRLFRVFASKRKYFFFRLVYSLTFQVVRFVLHKTGIWSFLKYLRKTFFPKKHREF